MTFNKNKQQIALCIIAFAVYFNTTFNDYALDDKAAVYNNSVTQKGIRAITEIFTHYYYYGGLSSNTHTYRPLTSLTHAIEWQFFQRNPAVSHLINILLFIVSIILLYKLLNLLFEKKFPGSYIPFFSSLLFCLHPVHTEVIANVKGRDELLSLLFVLSAVFYFVKHYPAISLKTYLISGLLFFLALLSKESSVLLLLYLPLVIYFFTQNTFLKSIKITLPFTFVAVLYAIVAYKILGTESIKDQVVFNVPYIYATTSQGFATKLYILIRYLLLLLFPHPLISDYTYNQIPYLNTYDFRFLLSVFIIVALLLFAFLYLKRKNIFAFCVLFFFASVSLVSNLFIQTGVMMAERSVYTGSIGFCIAMGFAIHLLTHQPISFSKIKLPNLSYLALIIILFLYSIKVISRNKDWKDDFHLFTHDVMDAPDCVKLLQLSGYYKYFSNPAIPTGQLPDVSTRNYCIQNLKKAIHILPATFPEPYVYLILHLFKL